MPTSLFTGAAGAESIQSFATSSTAQTTSVVRTMTNVQQQLTEAGVINGTESTGQTAGLIAAASTVGTNAVVGVVKQAASVTNALNTAETVTGNIGALATAAGVTLPGQAQTAINLVNNAQQTATALTSIATNTKNVVGAIGKGISASKLSDSLGGLGGIANSLNALDAANNALTGLLDSVKGISGSAFSAIKDSFGKLEANKPQNLSNIAKETAAKAAIAGNLPGGQPAFIKSLTNLVSSSGDVVKDAVSIANGINNSVSKLTGLAGEVTSAANSVTGAVSGVTKTINSVTGVAGNLTTTISGATGAINNITKTVSGAADAVSGLAKLPNTINTGTINNSIVNSSNQLATAAGSVVNTLTGISNTVNQLESAGKQVTTLINSATSNGVDNLANSISGAVDNVNSLAGAATSLSNGLSGLANAAKKTQSGGLAAKASQLSSGISNLPGGIKAFSSVLDKADDVLNKIPGTGQLTGLMNDLQTGATNGIGKVSSTLTSASTTIGQVGDALNKANNVIGSLGSVSSALGDLSSAASKAGGLTAAIAGKLPLGQAAQLLSSVSALGAGGANPIKLPSLGINTTNRTGITAQIKGVLGNPKIPEPNLLGDIKDETVDTLLQLQTATKARNQAEKKYKALTKEFNVAKKDFDTKYNTLPDGDPALDEAFIKVKEIAGRLETAIDEYEKTIAAEQEVAVAGLRDTPGGRLFGV
jgi:uncharacterized phage infection (PIP) family protein YhgE